MKLANKRRDVNVDVNVNVDVPRGEDQDSEGTVKTDAEDTPDGANAEEEEQPRLCDKCGLPRAAHPAPGKRIITRNARRVLAGVCGFDKGNGKGKGNDKGERKG